MNEIEKEMKLEEMLLTSYNKIKLLKEFNKFKITYFLNKNIEKVVELEDFIITLNSNYINDNYMYKYNITNYKGNYIASGKFSDIKNLLKTLTKLYKIIQIN